MQRFLAVLFFGLVATGAQAATVPLDRVAVVVDESVILQSDIDKRIADVRYQFEQRKQQLPPDDVLRKQVIDQMVLENLQLTQAEHAGIKIDDATLSAAMGDVAKQNGLTLQQFQEQLNKTPGTSYAEVREQIKRELMIKRLRQRRMQDRIRITDQDVQNFLKSPAGQAEIANEYRVAHILISLPEPATPEQITAAQKKADDIIAELKAGKDFAQVAAASSNAEDALQGGDLGWRKAAQLPSLVADLVVKMQVGDMAGPLRTPGAIHIFKLVDKHGDSMSVKQFHVRHILIKPTEILSSEDARQELNELRDKIVSKKASFGDEAKIHSDDPGSARNGGDLNWVSPGEMVPEFEQMMTKTPEGQVSDVFQTPFGWHILEVLGSRQQDMSEQYRANLARQALYARQYDEELASWLREMRAEAYVDIKGETKDKDADKDTGK